MRERHRYSSKERERDTMMKRCSEGERERQTDRLTRYSEGQTDRQTDEIVKQEQKRENKIYKEIEL